MSIVTFTPENKPTKRVILPAILATASLLALCGCIGAGTRLDDRPVPWPAKAVDLGRYTGRWYEFARFDAFFEWDCEAATADYRSLPDGTIEVVNACRAGSPSGPYRMVSGRAIVLPGSGNTRLKVSFFGPFFIGDYWVLDHADDYGWTIVGEPSGRYLWVLTRSPSVTRATADRLIGRVRALGYDTAALRRTAR